MPSAPEFGYACGNIGIIEVFGEREAEYCAKANRHVAVSGKIEIHMQHVRRGVYPVKQRGFFAAGLECVHKLRKHVCNKHLFTKAQYEPPCAVCGLVRVVCARGKLRFNIAVSHYRPRYKLGEHGYVRRKRNVIPLRLNVRTVNVYNVAYKLERIKAYAYGQGNVKRGYFEAEYRGEAFRKKVGVFEHAKHAKAQHKAYYKICLCFFRFAAFAYKPREYIALGYGQHHKHHIARLSPGIEYKAHQEQRRVFKPPRHKEIHRYCQRQKAI